MLWCRTCKNVLWDQEADLEGECPICGYSDLTVAGECEVCGEGMEDTKPAICPDCKEKVQQKWNEFKDGLEDTEIEYFLENVLDWEDYE